MRLQQRTLPFAVVALVLIVGCPLPAAGPRPFIVVGASYPGANAEVVADTVAAPVEQQVNGLDEGCDGLGVLQRLGTERRGPCVGLVAGRRRPQPPHPPAPPPTYSRTTLPSTLRERGAVRRPPRDSQAMWDTPDRCCFSLIP